jgi:hypothetical protein
MGCQKRDVLLNNYNDALCEWSRLENELVKDLEKARTESPLITKTEVARGMAQEAKTAFERHIADHSC